MPDGDFDFFNDRRRRRPPHMDTVDAIRNFRGPHQMNEWESAFVDSLHGFRRLTPKQIAALSDIYQKVMSERPRPSRAEKRARRRGRSRR